MSYIRGMVSSREAVRSATAFFEENLPSVDDVRLEEVELSPDEREWQITLSALVPVPRKAPPIVKGLGSIGSDEVLHPRERVFKKFSVRTADNAVLSMKIRVIEPAEQ